MNCLLSVPCRPIVLALCLFAAIFSYSQVPVTNDPPEYGPFNATFFPDGEGLKKNLGKDDTVLRADSPWSLTAWVRPTEAAKEPRLIAGVGEPSEEFSRFLALDGSHLLLWMGKDNVLSGNASLAAGKWHFLAATFDGADFRLFADGTLIASGKLDLGSVSPLLQIAPSSLPSSNWKHFGGAVASLTLLRNALGAAEIKTLSQVPQDFAGTLFEEGSKPWPVETHSQAGYRSPQDPVTMPRSKAQLSQPVAVKSAALPSLQANGTGQWILAGGWKMMPAPKVSGDGTAISQANFNEKEWYAATVPGTALTTLIDRGVYPDPDYGLNNLAIPESLNKQDYWYRVEFRAPKNVNGRQLTLTFEGINYEAAVWLNGQSLGSIKGAFIRGTFDVTRILKTDGANVLAVKVSPPPHP